MEDTKLFAAFEKHDQFVAAQDSLLRLDLNVEPSPEDNKKEINSLRSLTRILDEYQEQSYLLDPFLEQLVVPVVDQLKQLSKSAVSQPEKPQSPARIRRLTLLLYAFIKLRGYKTITRYFPHEVADLSIVVEFMLLPNTAVRDPTQWALRYVMLLWLALICMIPFDFAQFDEDDASNLTATSIESIAKEFLGKAGLERDGAATALSRFYTRKDTIVQFSRFLDHSADILPNTTDPFKAIGLLQVLCEVVKTASMARIKDNVPKLMNIISSMQGSEVLSINTFMRKFRTKLTSRIALRLLPGRSSANRHKGQLLDGTTNKLEEVSEQSIDVPEEVEIVLEQLFHGLEDKDTVVRWSAAKGVARIAERLPTDFTDQVLGTVMGLFSIHSIAAASLYDLPAIAECTWHGACLACAEMARRGLVTPKRLPELLDWLSKALYFDLRKGAHSIGSNVRDAAAYVLWALARTQSPSDLAPHADNLARRLVTVAIYDREIHIRRAASAAFQEYVGRTSLFPHGIDVLRKTDFYAVSIRRNSFLQAAPQVAEHLEYRMFVFDHLLGVTLRHWDVNMRELGAQSLRHICLEDLRGLGPQTIGKSVSLLDSVDTADLHGGLSGLTELSVAYRQSPLDADQLEHKLREIFKCLAKIPQATLLTQRNDLVTAAACSLIANAITLTEIELKEKSSIPEWRKIVDFGIKHPKENVQDAGAKALAAVSKLVDCSATVMSKLIRELKSATFPVQQSLGKVLGVIDYDAFPKCLPDALNCLLECAPTSSKMKSNVEARRNCYLALPLILVNVISHLPQRLSALQVNAMVDALIDGLNDYTTDERGDVGSWIRIACIRGLCTACMLTITNARHIPDFEAYLPPSKYHKAVSSILKQGVERLDHVRHEAGEAFGKLSHLSPPEVQEPGRWTVYQLDLIKEVFVREDEATSWIDGAWLFPKALQLLEISHYRQDILRGLVQSLGSKTDSTHRPLASSLVSYVRSLPVSNGGYDLPTFLEDLVQYAKTNSAANAIVIPVYQTFNVLLEGDALSKVSDDERCIISLKTLLSMATRSVDRLKNVQRIIESMKVNVNLLTLNAIMKDAVSSLPQFLSHQFPTVRSETAEYLYLMFSTRDVGGETDQVEEILLETEWTLSETDTQFAAARIVDKLSILQNERLSGVV